eukprot:gene15852-21979_t
MVISCRRAGQLSTGGKMEADWNRMIIDALQKRGNNTAPQWSKNRLGREPVPARAWGPRGEC